MIEAAIFSRLTNDAAVSALISSRVYPLILPQNSILPAVTYTRVSGERVRSLSGPSGLALPRFQIDSWAESFSVVKDLAGKIRKSLDGFRGNVSGVEIKGMSIESDSDLFETINGKDFYRVRADYFISHVEN